MRSRIAVLVFALWAPGLATAEARTYAVLSLVGDRLLVVTREMATGSRIDANTRQFIDMPSPDLDRAVLRAADAAVKKHSPDAEVVFLESRDPAIFAAQAKALDENAGAAGIIPAVREIAAASKATHLLLVTKQRHEAMLRVREGHIGSGALEGVGFYIDRTTRLTNSNTGETSIGYLAPFAYFRISLVEIGTGKVLGEEAVYASSTTGNRSALHPWDALSAPQKVARLQGMLRAETARVVPIVLKER